MRSAFSNRFNMMNLLNRNKHTILKAKLTERMLFHIRIPYFLPCSTVTLVSIIRTLVFFVSSVLLF